MATNAPRQLTLDLKVADFAVFDSFFPGPNDDVLQLVRQSAEQNSQPAVWLWGSPGSGRSHLLQAAVAAAGAAARTCAWLPLAGSVELHPAMLDGMGNLDLICVDDVDHIAGQPEWERAMFSLFEDLRAAGGNLLVSASCPPSEAAFELRDLASRLASGPVWKLQALHDDDLLAALKLRADWRGLDLPDETGHFLMRRVERSSQALFTLLDELDDAALAAQRRLTVPFVKAVLADRKAS